MTRERGNGILVWSCFPSFYIRSLSFELVWCIFLPLPMFYLNICFSLLLAFFVCLCECWLCAPAPHTQITFPPICPLFFLIKQVRTKQTLQLLVFAVLCCKQQQQFRWRTTKCLSQEMAMTGGSPMPMCKHLSRKCSC